MSRRLRSCSPPAALCNQCLKKEKQITYWMLKYRKLLSRRTQRNTIFKQLKNRVAYKKKTKIDIAHEIDKLSVCRERKILMKMQLRDQKSKMKWNIDERLLAQSMFYKNHACYEFLRNIGLSLPTSTSISHWLPVKTYKAGFSNKEAFYNIKMELSKYPGEKERYACLTFDEIHCRAELEYNKKLDRFDGVAEDGNCRTSHIGDSVCIFMIRGIFSQWKFVLGFVVSDGPTNREKLVDYIMSSMRVADDLGVKIVAVTCDQGTNNQSCYKSMGVTKDSPFFMYEKRKIYAFFDPPHLIKSVRNVLLKNDLDTQDGIVSWRVIEAIYHIDRQNVVRMCPKLTKDHIINIKRSTFKKMRVKLATQVLSRTVAMAIKTTKQFNSFDANLNPIAESTSNFILKFDRLFDLFNSRAIDFRDPYKAPLEKKSETWKKFFQEMLSYIETIQIKKNFPKERKKVVHVFDGFVQNINAINQLSTELFVADTEISFLLMGKFNQDIIENSFAKIRASGGNNCTPSVREICYALRRMINSKVEYVSDFANCEQDEMSLEITDEVQTVLPGTKYNETEKNEENDEENDEEKAANSDDEEDNDIIAAENLYTKRSADPTVEHTALSYFIGYVERKITDRIQCTHCAVQLTKAKTQSCRTDLFINLKNYNAEKEGGLRLPSDIFYDVCCLQVNHFKNIFKTTFFINNFKTKLKNEIIELTKKVYPMWFDVSNDCYQHRILLLEFLLTVLTFKHGKWLLEEINQEKTDEKFRRKLKKITC